MHGRSAREDTDLEAVRAVPLLGAVRLHFVPFVPELRGRRVSWFGEIKLRMAANLDGDDVVSEGEELLSEPVPVFVRPLVCEELDDLFAAVYERVAVPPAAVGLYGSRVSGVCVSCGWPILGHVQCRRARLSQRPWCSRDSGQP